MRRVDFFAYNSLSRCSPPTSLPLLPEAAALTLLELLIVGIIGLLLLLVAPAFTTSKGGTDLRGMAGYVRLNA